MPFLFLPRSESAERDIITTSPLFFAESGKEGMWHRPSFFAGTSNGMARARKALLFFPP